MENDTNKLEHFTETILRDADERSQKILESVEKARKARLNSAEKELKGPEGAAGGTGEGLSFLPHPGCRISERLHGAVPASLGAGGF